MLEPIRGVQLMQSLNALISQSPSLFHITTSLADRPVFLLPVFLLRMYVWRGMIRKHLSAKYGALLILAVAVLTIAINLGIQHFIDKARPETALLALGHLVMQHLPTRSFPSDHAAVSFAIAMGALMRGALGGRKKVTARGVVLLIGSIVMSISRVAVGVHRPTDILVGWGVGLFAALIIIYTPLKTLLTHYVIHYVIVAEEWISKKIFMK